MRGHPEPLDRSVDLSAPKPAPTPAPTPQPKLINAETHTYEVNGKYETRDPAHAMGQPVKRAN